MSAKDDGGSAFPHDFPDHHGMTLRDYFAAQAIRGGADALCDQLDPSITETTEAEALQHAQRHARAAYILADAMLAERSKP